MELEIGVPIEMTYMGLPIGDPLAQARMGIEIVGRELGYEVRYDPVYGPYVVFGTYRDAEAFMELVGVEGLCLQRQPSGRVYVLAE